MKSLHEIVTSIEHACQKLKEGEADELRVEIHIYDDIYGVHPVGR